MSFSRLANLSDCYACLSEIRMEGGELYEEIVKRKTFTEADAAQITRQLCKALAYLHERGIVHRDLKVAFFC